jgi:L,D-transpeptidase ErfK/SrfK
MTRTKIWNPWLFVACVVSALAISDGARSTEIPPAEPNFASRLDIEEAEKIQPATGGLRVPQIALPAANEMIGAVSSYTTHYEDTLLDIARANRLGYTEIVAANPDVDPWLPGEGTKIVLPTGHLLPNSGRTGIVINLGDHRLYYFGDGTTPVLSYPIGVGKEGWTTPLGRTTIVRKQENPSWYPGPAVRAEKPDLPDVVVPGPDNPLGTRAMYLGWDGYLVHGTNAPWGVGRRVSHGCIRLYPEDIVDLFERVAIGMPVEVVNQTIKLGWVDGELYLEAHPESWQVSELMAKGAYQPDASTVEVDATLEAEFRAIAGEAYEDLDWDTIKRELMLRSGVPVRISSAFFW